jgi:hypothetical protein
MNLNMISTFVSFGAIGFLLLTGCDQSFKAVDALESISSEGENSVISSLSIVEPVNNSYKKGELNVAGQCDDGKNIIIKVDNRDAASIKCVNGQYSVYLNVSGEGVKNITVIQEGQSDNILTRSIVNDQMAPLVSITTPANNDYSKNSFVLMGTCERNLKLAISFGGNTYDIDCPNGSFANTYDISSMQDGAIDVSVEQTDVAGNKTSRIVKINKDTVAPQISGLLPANNSQVNAMAMLSGNCESGLKVVMSGTGLTSIVETACANSQFSSQVVFSNGSGTKAVSFSQTDLAGNSSSVSRSYQRQAESAPNITITSPAANYVFNTGNLSISGDCTNGLNINVAGAGNNNPSQVSCSNSKYTTVVVMTSGDGSKNIIVTQKNASGIEGAASRSFIKDSTGPALTISSPLANTTVKSTVSVAGSCENNIAINFTGDINNVNGACSFGAYNQTLTLSAGQGLKSITVSQVDGAGNSTVKKVNVISDTVAPAVTISSPVAGFQAETGVDLVGSCESGLPVLLQGTGIAAQKQVNCTNGAFQSNLLFSNGIGTKTIQVSQTDGAGNTGNSSRNFQRIEVVPPQLTGVQLYTQSCASCHSNIDSSTKLNRTAAQIRTAINTIGSMSNLSGLNDSQLTLIAEALNTNSVSNDDQIPYISGKYLPTAESLACDTNNNGKTSNGTRRLTRKQMVNSLDKLFGSTAMSQESVKASIELLPLEGDIGLVDGFDNSISYVEGLYTVADALTTYVFNNTTRLNALLPNCSVNPISTQCKTSYENFGRRALRRTLSASQKQMYADFLASYSDSKEGLRYTIIRFLMSPRFHNFLEFESAGESGKIAIDPFEVATRLSYGITNNPPDDQLLDAAEANQLNTITKINTHAERLIGSADAKKYFNEFLISMMRLETQVDPISIMQTVMGINPVGISKEMEEEFKRFVDYTVFQNNGTFYDLLNEQKIFPYTSRLAQYFGVSTSSSAVTGPEYRSGLLMRPLVVKSGKAVSAPIPRGVLMRQQFLCSNLPSPNAQIIDERLKELDNFSHLEYSNREIVTNITDAPACLSCHSQINSLGFVMESFGPFGEFRTVESVFDNQGRVIANHNIDTNVDGVLIAGRNPASVSSPKLMADTLAKAPSTMRCFSQQMFRFTRLRNAQSDDGCSLNEAADALINGGTVKSGIIKNVVNDSIFWRYAE